jgi:hypothetical protein
MTFELLIKGERRGKRLDANEISIGKSGFAFGNAVQEVLAKAEFLEIYIDRTRNIVGFKPSRNSAKGFKVLEEGRRCSCKHSAKFPKGRYTAKMEDGMFVIRVLEIASEKTSEKKYIM